MKKFASRNHLEGVRLAPESDEARHHSLGSG